MWNTELQNLWTDFNAWVIQKELENWICWHGLQGNSDRTYMIGLSKNFHFYDNCTLQENFYDNCTLQENFYDNCTLQENFYDNCTLQENFRPKNRVSRKHG